MIYIIPIDLLVFLCRPLQLPQLPPVEMPLQLPLQLLLLRDQLPLQQLPDLEVSHCLQGLSDPYY